MSPSRPKRQAAAVAQSRFVEVFDDDDAAPPPQEPRQGSKRKEQDDSGFGIELSDSGSGLESVRESRALLPKRPRKSATPSGSNVTLDDADDDGDAEYVQDDGDADYIEDDGVEYDGYIEDDGSNSPSTKKVDESQDWDPVAKQLFEFIGDTDITFPSADVDGELAFRNAKANVAADGSICYQPLQKLRSRAAFMKAVSNCIVDCASNPKTAKQLKKNRSRICEAILLYGTDKLWRIIDAVIEGTVPKWTATDLNTAIGRRNAPENVMRCAYTRLTLGDEHSPRLSQDQVVDLAGDEGLPAKSIYDGQTEHVVRRTMEHDAEFIMGAHPNSPKNIAAKESAGVFQLVLVNLDHLDDPIFANMTDDDHAELLTGVEAWVTTATGAYEKDGNIKYEKVRAEYGLGRIPGLKGVNSTTCIASASARRNKTVWAHNPTLMKHGPPLLRAAQLCIYQYAALKDIKEGTPRYNEALQHAHKLKRDIEVYKAALFKAKYRLLETGEMVVIAKESHLSQNNYVVDGLWLQPFPQTLFEKLVDQGIATRLPGPRYMFKVQLVDTVTKTTLAKDIFQRPYPPYKVYLAGLQVHAHKGKKREALVKVRPAYNIFPGIPTAAQKGLVSMSPSHARRQQALSMHTLYKVGDFKSPENPEGINKVDARLSNGEARLDIQHAPYGGYSMAVIRLDGQRVHIPTYRFIEQNPQLTYGSECFMRLDIDFNAHEVSEVRMHLIKDEKTGYSYGQLPVMPYVSTDGIDWQPWKFDYEFDTTRLDGRQVGVLGLFAGFVKRAGLPLLQERPAYISDTPPPAIDHVIGEPISNRKTCKLSIQHDFQHQLSLAPWPELYAQHGKWQQCVRVQLTKEDRNLSGFSAGDSIQSRLMYFDNADDEDPYVICGQPGRWLRLPIVRQQDIDYLTLFRQRVRNHQGL